MFCDETSAALSYYAALNAKLFLNPLSGVRERKIKTETYQVSHKLQSYILSYPFEGGVKKLKKTASLQKVNIF